MTHDHSHDEHSDAEIADEDALEVVHLTDEDGEESAWGFLGVVQDGGREYAILSPVEQLLDEESDTMEVVLLRYAADADGSEVFTEIEDDDERARVEVVATQYLSDEGLSAV